MDRGWNQATSEGMIRVADAKSGISRTSIRLNLEQRPFVAESRRPPGHKRQTPVSLAIGGERDSETINADLTGVGWQGKLASWTYILTNANPRLPAPSKRRNRGRPSADDQGCAECVLLRKRPIS